MSVASRKQKSVQIIQALSLLAGVAPAMQLDMFGGDPEKALDAYNAGPDRVLRAGGIPAIAETRNYVASILSRLSYPVRR